MVALHLRKLTLLAVWVAALFLGGCADTYVIGESKAAGKAPPGPSMAVKPALLRLEDVGPGGPYESEESLHKLYVIADYLHREGVPFHISLIPRMVVPKKGYDVTIADDTAYARRFLSTIKQMEKMGGIVGVHGYTHQSGRDPSGWGFEFYDPLENPVVPNTLEYARDRIDRAISLFQRAGITPAYWETPHYTASLRQYPAFEEQSGLMYENRHRLEMAGNYRVSDYPGGSYRGFVTVPTPLGCVDRDGDVEKMIKKLDHLGNDLASFFYHPFREFRYMYKDYNARGEVYYIYDQKSPLHVLVSAFREKGYTFVSVYSLVRFIPAHRLEAIPFREGDAVLAGRFGSEGGKGVLVWNRRENQWRVYEYTAAWHSPRRITAFAELRVGSPDLEKDAVLLAGDFNGDKRDDLLVFNPRSGAFQLAENTGGGFAARGRVSPGLEGIKSVIPLAGDFNGDGLADVAVHDPEKGRIGIALRSENGVFKRNRWISIDHLKGNNVRLLAGDFNGDRRDDIVACNTVSGDWKVLLAGPGGKSFAPAGNWIDRWGAGGAWLPFAADLNGDGKCDLILYSRLGHWQVAVSDGQRFVWQGDFGPWGSSQKGVPLVADLNGDGRSDLVIIDETRSGGYNLDVALSVMDR